MACCSTHVIQRSLRPPGGKGYVIPRGFGFDYITCANYTFEVWGWILFAAATWTLPALMFIAAGAGQMAIWAKAKHARLRKVRLWCSDLSDSVCFNSGAPGAAVPQVSDGRMDRWMKYFFDRQDMGWGYPLKVFQGNPAGLERWRGHSVHAAF